MPLSFEGALENGAKLPTPSRLEPLDGADRGHAEAVLAGDLDRVGGGHEHLREVDAGGRARVEGVGRPVGVHPAVAVEGEAEGPVLAGRPVRAEGGHGEVPAVALHGPGGEAEGARVARGVAGHAVGPVRVEEREAGVPAGAEEGHRGRVRGRREAVQVEGGAGAGHRLVVGPVAVGEVAVGGERGRGREGEHECRRERGDRGFAHG